MADIPKWAFDRAFELARERGHIDVSCSAMDAFAHYIAEHEEPPVDRLLVEAREMLASDHTDGFFDFHHGGVMHKHGAGRVHIIGGMFDNNRNLRQYMAALKRGMELAREVQP